MTAESTRAALAMLLSESEEAASQVFAEHYGLQAGDRSLEQLVRENLVAHGHQANIRESLLETLHAGGAVGESVQACLLRSGLLGWQ